MRTRWRRSGEPGILLEMQITLTNRQRRIRFDIDWLRQFSVVAVAECVGGSSRGTSQLLELSVVEVAVVSDRAIARVHQEFMGIPGATDVITFEHGEIVVSADTAERYASGAGHSTVEELALYVVHGLLHLSGYDDRDAVSRRRMHRVQDRIWRSLLKRMDGSRRSKQ